MCPVPYDHIHLAALAGPNAQFVGKFTTIEVEGVPPNPWFTISTQTLIFLDAWRPEHICRRIFALLNETRAF